MWMYKPTVDQLRPAIKIAGILLSLSYLWRQLTAKKNKGGIDFTQKTTYTSVPVYGPDNQVIYYELVPTNLAGVYVSPIDKANQAYYNSLAKSVAESAPRPSKPIGNTVV